MNEHKNIITIEDEIKEFSDKPVKSSALFKALEEKGVPDSSESSAGDVLSLDEDKKPTWAAPSGGGDVLYVTFHWGENDTITCNHTFNEISVALENKKLVIFSEEINKDMGTGYYATGCDFGDNAIAVKFNYGSLSSTTVLEYDICRYIIRPNNTVEYTSESIYIVGSDTDPDE